MSACLTAVGEMLGSRVSTSAIETRAGVIWANAGTAPANMKAAMAHYKLAHDNLRKFAPIVMHRTCIHSAER